MTLVGPLDRTSKKSIGRCRMALEIVFIECDDEDGTYVFTDCEIWIGINSVEEFVALETANGDAYRYRELERHVAGQLLNRCCGTIVALTLKSSGRSCVVAVHKH